MNDLLIVGAGNVFSDTMQTFGIQPAALIGQFIVFLVVYLILNKFAFPPIMEILEERKRKIAEAEENSKKITESIENTENNIKKMISEANEKSRNLIEEAKKSAEVVGESKKQEAINEAQKLLEKARVASNAERDRLISDLKHDFGKMIVTATSKVTGKVLEKSDIDRINKESLEEINI